MKRPISAEDIKKSIMKHENLIRNIALSLAIAISILNFFYITPSTISDTNPYSFNIVPTIMLPIFSFILFLRGKAEPKDVKAGVSLFALFIALFLFLRIKLSYIFLSARVDALLLPLLISSYIFLIFGKKGFNSGKYLVIYSIFTSPYILSPIILMNKSFAEINSVFVFIITKLFYTNILFEAPYSIIAGNYNIQIGQSCVNIGDFLALLLFIVPVAFLFNTGRKEKLEAVALGIICLLIFNIIRMSIIALSSITYGVNEGVSIFHSVSGTIIFYASLIISMAYLLKKADRNNFMERQRKERRKSRHQNYSVLLAISFSLIFFFMTLNYSTAITYPMSKLLYTRTMTLSENMSLIKSIELSEPLFILEINQNRTEGALLLYRNKTSTPIEVLLNPSTQSAFKYIEKNNRVVGSMFVFGSTGIVGRAGYVISNSTPFFIYQASLPSFSNSSYEEVSTLVIIPANMLNESCTRGIDWIYTYMLNPFSHFNNSTVKDSLVYGTCEAEEITTGE
ncbi:MAG: exosortase/archaeosortase family protein [Candidatus Micrarchaeaceae archaeon]